MGKKKNKPSFWRKFLFFSKNKPNAAEEFPSIPVRAEFSEELKKAESRYFHFYQTKQWKIGEGTEKKNYKISKTGTNLFKLEGEDFQIILNPGVSIQEKNGKWTGILHPTEAMINRLLQKDRITFDMLLEEWGIPKDTTELAARSRSAVQELGTWDRIWQEQVLLRLRPDTTAILLVSLGEEFQRFYLKIATKKQKEIIHDELFYLNQGKNSQSASPHSKNKTLYDSDFAWNEFLEVWTYCKERKELRA